MVSAPDVVTEKTVPSPFAAPFIGGAVERALDVDDAPIRVSAVPRAAFEGVEHPVRGTHVRWLRRCHLEPFGSAQDRLRRRTAAAACGQNRCAKARADDTTG